MLATTQVPQTINGLSPFKSLDLDETEEAVKTSAGKLYGGWVYNKALTAIYLKFYNNTVANVTVGTTVPEITIGIPTGFFPLPLPSEGVAFPTAITVAATTGIADNDTGAPAANDVNIALFYK